MTRGRSCVALLACIVLLLPAAVLSQASKRPVPAVAAITSESLTGLLRRDSGSVVLVNIWATWCAPCRAELPSLLRLRREFDTSGLKVIFISSDEPEDLEGAVVPLLDSLGVDFLTYIDRDSSQEAFINGLAKEWGGAIPATFLYDRRGVRRAMLVGGKTYVQFKNALLPLLREQE